MGSSPRPTQASAISPVQSVFNLLATDAYKTSLQVYFDKWDQVFAWIRVVGMCLILVAMLLALKRLLPASWSESLLGRAPLGLLLLAGITLGLASSIRIAGPFRGSACRCLCPK